MDDGSGIAFAVGLVFLIIMMIPYVLIVRKAGYSGWWVLTLFVPVVNFIMIWVFALARWPIEDRAAGAGAERVF